MNTVCWGVLLQLGLIVCSLSKINITMIPFGMWEYKERWNQVWFPPLNIFVGGFLATFPMNWVTVRPCSGLYSRRVSEWVSLWVCGNFHKFPQVFKVEFLWVPTTESAQIFFPGSVCVSSTWVTTCHVPHVHVDTCTCRFMKARAQKSKKT